MDLVGYTDRILSTRGQLFNEWITLSTEVFAQQTTVRYPVDSDLPSG